MTTTETTPAAEARTGFHSLSAGGLNWKSLPLQLFARGNSLTWNPAAIDFSDDAEHWRALSDEQRRSATYLCAQFIAGEEAVTQDLLPFVTVMSAEGRFGDEMYLTQFLYEEARHTQGFRLWLDEVGMDTDLHPYVAENPHYRRLFYDELPNSLAALDADPSPRNQIRASVTYNHVIEGSLALTGYHAWHRICRTHQILPGMQELIRLIGIDERRHMAWGTYTCRRLVAADDRLWDTVTERMGELLPHALAMIEWVSDRFDDEPFGLDSDEFAPYAADRAQRRLSAISAARGRPVDEIDLDHSPAELEETFAAEDAAAAAETTTG